MPEICEKWNKNNNLNDLFPKNDKIHRMKTRAVENTKYNLQIQKDLKSIIVIQKIQEY